MRACLPRPRLPIAAGLVCLTAAIPLLADDPTPARDNAAPPAAVRDELPFGPALLLPTDSARAREFAALPDYLAARQWDEAARLLQGFLDLPEDVFLPVKARDADGKEVTGAVSLRAEAVRRIAALPGPGLEAYETAVGPRARAALAAAKGEPAGLVAVVQRYPQTRAGAEAAARLGAYHLDRGRAALAAGYFARHLRSAGAGTPGPLVLFQAALAFRRAGDEGRAAETWKRLAAAAADGVRVGDRDVPLALLEKEFRRPRRSPAAADAAGAVGEPAGEATWRQATAAEPNAAAWVQEAARKLEADSQPALSAAVPVVAGGKVFFRGGDGVRVVNLKTGVTCGAAPSPLALDVLVGANHPNEHAAVGAWVDNYRAAGRQGVLLENSVVGTLSSDGTRVYAVEDLPVPAFPTPYFSFAAKQGEGLGLPGAPDLTRAVYHSRLLALDTRDAGRVLWEVGTAAGPALLRDCYFLGPPLPLGGKLYVAVQKGFDLRLVCLEPATGAPVWSQALATYKSRMVLDGGRRLHAVRLAYADGLLVCPTNAGGVVAFDLIGRSLAWAHGYREEPPPPDPPPFRGRGGRFGRAVYASEPPNLVPEWKASAPLIVGDRVVFTAPDAPELRCLDLHDGALRWRVKREDGNLFLAGAADGRVLIAGKREVRAVALADGKPLWACATAAPSGRGALAGELYYQPVRPADGKPEVLAIDVRKGAVRSRTALPGKEAAGNLLFHDGMMLSQSYDAVTAYPQRAAKKP